MRSDLDQLVDHDHSDNCPVCKAQELVAVALIPAAAAWELHNELPRLSVALHGAAGLLGAMLEEGVPRNDVDDKLRVLLDDIEREIAEDKAMGGPPRGNA